MQKILPLLIGFRYLRAKRDNAFIAFINVFALIGMALGVMALIIVLSVMNGFDRELKERILRTVSHGYLKPEGGLSDANALIARLQQTLPADAGIVGLAPFVESKALLTASGQARGAQLLGVDPIHELDVSDVADAMLEGALSSLQAGQYRVLMGSLLADILGVSVGDSLVVTLPYVMMTPAGPFARSRRFYVAGLFETGSQSDQSLVLMHIDDAKALLRTGGKSQGLRVKTRDLYEAPRLLKQLATRVDGPVEVLDWSQTQGHLFQAVKMEKTVVGFLLGIIIAVAAFNIVTSLIMMIAEKRSDIAVLRTLGMRARGIVAIFVVQGLVLGWLGIALGSALGIAAALSISHWVAWVEQAFGWQVFDPTVYFVTALPSVLQWRDIVWVSGGAAVVSLLATAYPAYRASQIQPAEALRYSV
jgi:lipoprotein-releasing system permease protein